MDNRNLILDDLPEEIIQQIAGQADVESAAALKFSSKQYYNTLDALFFQKTFKEQDEAVKTAFNKIIKAKDDKFIETLINSVIETIFNYINHKDKSGINAPSHQLTHHDKGYHRAFCFLNIFQCPPAPPPGHLRINEILEEYTPLTNDQKLLALYVLLNEKNGIQLKKYAVEQLKQHSDSITTTITEMLLIRYGSETLNRFQEVLLEQIHKHSYNKFYREEVQNRYSSRTTTKSRHESIADLKHGPDLSSTTSSIMYTTHVERCWSKFFVAFDQELKLKKSEKSADNARRCLVM